MLGKLVSFSQTVTAISGQWLYRLPSYLHYMSFKLVNWEYFISETSCVAIFTHQIQTEQQESVTTGSVGEKLLQPSLSCLLHAISLQGGFKTQHIVQSVSLQEEPVEVKSASLYLNEVLVWAHFSDSQQVYTIDWQSESTINASKIFESKFI